MNAEAQRLQCLIKETPHIEIFETWWDLVNQIYDAHDKNLINAYEHKALVDLLRSEHKTINDLTKQLASCSAPSTGPWTS